MQQRPVVMYIAMSLDGYIAGINDDLGFLSMVEVPGEDYGYAEFIAAVDTVIIGRRTYDKLKTFEGPFWHASRKCIVLTQTPREANEDAVFYTGSPNALIEELRSTEGGTIFLDGGAEAIAAFRKEGLIDKYIVSIIPTLLGDGVRLFDKKLPTENLKLTRSISFPSGLVQLWYEKMSNTAEVPTVS